MTDNEIIKALECCVNADCENCPSKTICDSDTERFVVKVSDLINRQKEEIDVWRSAYDVAYSTNTELYEALKTARAETAKEVAFVLKAMAAGRLAWDEYDEEICGFLTVDEIDNLLKEFTEGNSDGESM